MKKIYTHIMTGVSYFLPFVIAGGILSAAAYLLDAGNSATTTFGHSTAITAWLLNIGGTVMGMMLPFLAAYIAYSIADKPGIVLGIAGGLLARDGGSGFLGAIAAGLLSGYIILGLKKLTAKFPRSLEGIKSLLIFPVVGVLLIGIAMLGINFLVTPINLGLTAFLTSLNSTSAVIMGAVIGAMLAADMGGPINKAAYLFAVSTLTNASGHAVASVVMAACGSSAMVVSTACAVAATIFPKRFSIGSRSAKVAAYIMGLAFFVEGAIPFVIEKPKKILPALIIGAAVTGAITAAAGVTLGAPIGGLETLLLVSNIPVYLLSVVIGIAVAVGIIAITTRNDVGEEELD